MKRNTLLSSLLIVTAVLFAPAARGSALRFCLRSEPRTLNPLLVEDDASETIRFLTAGVLIRLNRATQQLEPALATSWKVSRQGRRIDFVVRQGVLFSDGTPFGPGDVVYTMQQLLSPELHSPLADSFGAGQSKAVVRVTGGNSVSVEFPSPIASLEQLFDGVPLLSARSPAGLRAVLGPYEIRAHQPGSGLVLKKNARYWARDEQGAALPWFDEIRIDIQQNRGAETLRLSRGEIDLIQNLDAESFDELAKSKPKGIRLIDAGPSLDSELLWFNQTPQSSLLPARKAWFADPRFRRAVSMAIRRDDICRIVYRGHATPALGPVSPANQFWFNRGLPGRSSDLAAAHRAFADAGFHFNGSRLTDAAGTPVEFSLISNSGNKAHEKMLAMIQQDLAGVGIRVRVVLLDFASLLERITRSFDYEACLMSLTNVELDPNEQMNVWLSSASNHQWNPSQKAPATSWERRIDELMAHQSSTPDRLLRKKLFDEVQAVVREQEPFLYLVHPNALSAVSTRLANIQPALLRPQLYWNVEALRSADAR